MTERLVPVCTPACLAALPPRGVARFSGATLLHVTSATEDWAAWLQDAGIEGVDLTKGLRFDVIQHAFNAAKEGLGIAIGRRPLIDPDLASGALVPASDHVVESEAAYWLVSSQKIADRAPAGILRRWLIGHLTGPAQTRPRKKLIRK